MIKRIDIELFRHAFYFYCPDLVTSKFPKGTKEIVKKFDIHLQDPTTGGFVYEQEGGIPWLVIRANEEGEIDWTDLSHEACHLAFVICGDRGVVVREGKVNETFCYLVTFILQKIFEVVS